METKEANNAAQQSDAELTYEMYKETKAYMGEFMILQQKHEAQRKQEAAAEAQREETHGKRNRLSRWWYNCRIARRDERWWQEEQELLEMASPMKAFARFKEHEKKLNENRH